MANGRSGKSRAPLFEAVAVPQGPVHSGKWPNLGVCAEAKREGMEEGRLMGHNEGSDVQLLRACLNCGHHGEVEYEAEVGDSATSELASTVGKGRRADAAHDGTNEDWHTEVDNVLR